ncbi:MAG: radical SAM protein [Anaerolineae bacterium]
MHKSREALCLPLDAEHTLAFDPLQGVPVVLNRAAYAFWDAYPSSTSEDSAFEMRQLLAFAGLLQPESKPSACPADQPYQLSAWLHVTDRCTLRCDYCYLPHLPNDMAIDTGFAAIEATFRSAVAHGYRVVKLKYAGGEPLLRLPQILAWQQHAAGLAVRHGLALDGIVLSNGTLLSAAYASAIRDAGLRLMLSLDSLGQTHNSQRAFPDGRDSSETVQRAIELALANGLIPDISITVSGRNANGLPDLIAWVLEHDLPFSLNLYREHGYTEPSSDLQLETRAIIAALRAVYEVVDTYSPRRSLLGSLADRANLAVPHRYPCSAGRSYLVFKPDGEIAKCQMDQGHIVANCNTPDPLQAVQQSPVGLQNPSVDEKADCGTCMWRYRCAGGCPLQAWRASEAYTAKSPNCALYQALYPEVLRLEGRRLLRYGVRLIATF